jgi:hypothetical protein
MVYDSPCQVIVGQYGGLDQTVLQLNSEPNAKEVGFLLIRVAMVGPVLGKDV